MALEAVRIFKKVQNPAWSSIVLFEEGAAVGWSDEEASGIG
jgi:hypothetical protein